MERAIHKHHGRLSADYHDSHTHVHGVVDEKLATTARGLAALKWSFIVLALGGALQVALLLVSGSVALLADAIHNAADAMTAIPLGIAFLLMKRGPTRRFTYGLGRVEDFAGVAIVLVILLSAIAAAYEAMRRLFHPHPVGALGALTVAGLIGFLANELAAVIRMRAGQEIHSAALVADGQHARVDGLASLAVAASAGAIKLGYPMADPIIGLAITALIFGIVWESAVAVFTRMLDGVEPGVVDEIRRLGRQVQEIRDVGEVRARWIGHRLHAEADIAIDPRLSVGEGIELARRFEFEVRSHLPELRALHVGVRPAEESSA
jgi:cation diffusion facilitator family transporter